MNITSADRYAVLEANSPVYGQLAADPSGPLVAGRRIAWAVNHERQRLLIVPLAGAAPVPDGLSTDGVRVRSGETPAGPSLIIKCQDPQNGRQFALLADDLVQALQSGPGNPLPAVSRVLEAWRRLFSAASDTALSEAQIKGLIGELLVLDELAEVDPGRAVAAWMGPEGGRHDFRAGSTALEVKATANIDGTKVKINGLHQLEGPAGGALWLRVVQLEAVPGGDLSIPHLVEAVLAKGVAAASLLTKLEAAGYRDAERDRYSLPTYGLLSNLLYRVDDSFPRLIPASLSDPSLEAQLTDVRYSVDVSTLPPVGEADRAVLMRGLLT